MAAGIGSRFGTGIKQLAKVDQGGHIIMDYSIHDAIEAGFDKIIFIIRKDIENEFMEVIGDRIRRLAESKGVEVGFAFQDINDVPGDVPEGRTKPWGTGQAVLAARELIDSPFAVINADDYYGKKAFGLMHDALAQVSGDQLAMIGYKLANTLSDNGSVTRGVCQTKDGYLTGILETHNIVKAVGREAAERAMADVKGVEAYRVRTIGEFGEIELDSLVSMNMWGFDAGFVGKLADGFAEFFDGAVKENPEKCEYLIPVYVGELLERGDVKVRVLATDDTWYGMTYQEDVQAVREAFEGMISNGVYQEELFSDL